MKVLVTGAAGFIGFHLATALAAAGHQVLGLDRFSDAYAPVRLQVSKVLGAMKDKALAAHDNKKRDLLEWAKFNRVLLAHHKVYATGTTGEVLERELGFPIHKLQSGPLGGDQQVGAKIVDGEIDFLIFFWDPLEPMPHDPDVKALLRMAVVWNIPIACNRASADFMISSPLMDDEYDRLLPDYDSYRSRKLDITR